MVVEVRLYATLRQYSPPGSQNGIFSATIPSGADLSALLSSLAIDPAKVHLRMVNGVSAELGRILRENDRIGLSPPVGGG